MSALVSRTSLSTWETIENAYVYSQNEMIKMIDCDLHWVSYLFLFLILLKIYNHFGSSSTRKRVIQIKNRQFSALVYHASAHLTVSFRNWVFIFWRLAQSQRCCFREWWPAPAYVLSVLLFHGWGPGIEFGCPAFPCWGTGVEKGRFHVKTIPVTRKQMNTGTLRFHLVRFIDFMPSPDPLLYIFFFFLPLLVA